MKNTNMRKAVALTVKYTNNEECMECAYASTEEIKIGAIVKLDTGDYGIVKNIYTTSQTLDTEAYNLNDRRAA